MPRRLGGWAPALAALTLAGCQPRPDTYYDIAPAVAFARLRQADIIGFRNARQCGMLIYFTEQDHPPDAITWTVASGGVDALNFTLRVTPQGSGSLVTIEVPKAADGGEFYDAEETYRHPVLMQPLRPSLRELIDAAIQTRPYDWRRIAPPLNSGGICGSLRQNFEASGVPYDMHDPSGMTHQQAEDARERGEDIPVEPDPLP